MSARFQPQSRELLATRLGSLKPLSPVEFEVLHAIEARRAHMHHPNIRVMAEGARISTAQVITSGWAGRIRQLADGRRQVIGILLPGDAIGLCARRQPLSLTLVVSLTALWTVEAHELSSAIRDAHPWPNLSEALAIGAAEEEYYLTGHIVCLGRQTAYERVAYLFCELDQRLAGRNLSIGNSFELPLTQEMIADVVGLSVVHVNRTLQQMRREGSIGLARGRLSILDLAELRRAAEFVPPKVSAT